MITLRGDLYASHGNGVRLIRRGTPLELLNHTVAEYPNFIKLTLRFEDLILTRYLLISEARRIIKVV